MKLVPWFQQSPAATLSRDFEGMFKDFFSGPGFERLPEAFRRPVAPAVNLAETEQEYQAASDADDDSWTRRRVVLTGLAGAPALLAGACTVGSEQPGESPSPAGGASPQAADGPGPTRIRQAVSRAQITVEPKDGSANADFGQPVKVPAFMTCTVFVLIFISCFIEPRP